MLCRQIPRTDGPWGPWKSPDKWGSLGPTSFPVRRRPVQTPPRSQPDEGPICSASHPGHKGRRPAPRRKLREDPRSTGRRAESQEPGTGGGAPGRASAVSLRVARGPLCAPISRKVPAASREARAPAEPLHPGPYLLEKPSRAVVFSGAVCALHSEYEQKYYGNGICK